MATLIRYVEQPPQPFAELVEERNAALNSTRSEDDIYVRESIDQRASGHRKRHKTFDNHLPPGSITNLELPTKKDIDRKIEQVKGIKFFIKKIGERHPSLSLSFSRKSDNGQQILVQRYKKKRDGNNMVDGEMSIPIVRDSLRGKYKPVYIGSRELYKGIFPGKKKSRRVSQKFSGIPIIKFLIDEYSKGITLTVTVFAKEYENGYVDDSGWEVILRNIA